MGRGGLRGYRVEWKGLRISVCARVYDYALY